MTELQLSKLEKIEKLSSELGLILDKKILNENEKFDITLSVKGRYGEIHFSGTGTFDFIIDPALEYLQKIKDV